MKSKRLITAVIGLCFVLIVCSLSVLGEEIPDGFTSWDEYYDSILNGENEEQEEMPDVEDMKVVDRNERLTMYYYKKGVDIFLKDNATGKIFGTALPKGYLEEDIGENLSGNLLTVSYTNKENSLFTADLTSDSGDFTVKTYYVKHGLILDVKLNSADIKFGVYFTLTDDGMKVTIPTGIVKEGKNNKLISIKLLPVFAAAKPGEEGYVFYPDGSGAVMNIQNYRKAKPEFYNYPIYCDDKADFEIFKDNERQDIKGLMLPVYGIKHTQNGVFAEITSGAENARFNMNVDALYTNCFEFFYRTFNEVKYSFSSGSSGKINKVGKKSMNGEKTVVYHILEEGKNTYSDMAVLYRNALIDRGVLVRQEKTENVPLSLEFFMGISKNGILGDSIQTLTSFDFANKTVNDLYKRGIKDMDVILKGWSDGGYGTLPTSENIEKKFGTESSLKSLNKNLKDKKGNLYLLADFINANTKTNKINLKKYGLRDGLDNIVTDKDNKTLSWINPYEYLPAAVPEFVKANRNYGNICFDNFGRWLLSDSGDTNFTNRDKAVGAMLGAMKYAGKVEGSVAVTGGNSYIWKYADRIYDLPDCDSQYYQNDYSVPFYQMVIHGFRDYSSLAANLAFDYKYQTLRFVETGSIPHFILTENSTNLLKGTDYDRIFSSEYSDWNDKIVSVWENMQNRLSSVWGLTIDKHEYLSRDLVKISYEDSSSVYINYAEKEVSVDGITVPAMDYYLVGGTQS